MSILTSMLLLPAGFGLLIASFSEDGEVSFWVWIIGGLIALPGLLTMVWTYRTSGRTLVSGPFGLRVRWHDLRWVTSVQPVDVSQLKGSFTGLELVRDREADTTLRYSTNLGPVRRGAWVGAIMGAAGRRHWPSQVGAWRLAGWWAATPLWRRVVGLAAWTVFAVLALGLVFVVLDDAALRNDGLRAEATVIENHPRGSYVVIRFPVEGQERQVEAEIDIDGSETSLEVGDRIEVVYARSDPTGMVALADVDPVTYWVATCWWTSFLIGWSALLAAWIAGFFSPDVREVDLVADP